MAIRNNLSYDEPRGPDLGGNPCDTTLCDTIDTGMANFKIQGKGVKIYYNTVIGGDRSKFKVMGRPDAANTNPQNIAIYNNTMVARDAHEILGIPIQATNNFLLFAPNTGTDTMENIVVRNNIMYNMRSDSWLQTTENNFVEFQNCAPSEELSFNHNIYYSYGCSTPNGGNASHTIFLIDSVLKSFTEFQNDYNQESKGMYADPLLDDVCADPPSLSLTTASFVAIDKGAPLPVDDVATTNFDEGIPALDFDQAAVPYNCGVDIGAYEFVATVANTNTNTTWNTDMHVFNDVTVETGFTLTIEDATIWFGDGVTLTVEPGARLVVDGATLTAGCNMWQGIQVWGDPGAAPDATFPSSAQGILELSNGATVENAVLGVYLGKDNDCCNFSGGIIKSMGGTATEDPILFRNNRKHVAFGPYGFESLSRFENTDFVCDAPMQDVEAYAGAGSQQYVSIWDQDGIVFTNCVFENAITYDDENGDPQQFGENGRGGGIRAIDAEVVVTGDVPPEEDAYSARFTGMIWGVMTLRTMESLSEIRVENALFDNNADFGLLSEGSLMDRVSNCKFKVPSTADANRGIGIHMVDNTDHIVNDNKFVAFDNNPPNFGYICSGSTAGVNTGGLLWTNEFDGFNVATQTQNHNQSLEMRCNRYLADNEFDWRINPETQNGILGPQGTGCVELSEYRAGNIFDDGASQNIRNWAQPFNYCYPNISDQTPVFIQLELNPLFCQSITSGDGSCDTQPFLMAPNGDNGMAQLAAANTTMTTLLDELDTIMVYLDSAYTDTLLAHIADVAYSNATLTSELLQYSFLSDTVLNAACARTPSFTDAQLQSILLSNSPVTRRVWPFLRDVLEVLKAKSSAYGDTILSAQLNENLRTPGLIEKEIQQASKQRFWGIKEVVAHYAAFDTEPDSLYAMIHFLSDSLADKQWNRLAVGVAMDADTLSWARSILNNLSLETADDSVFYDYHDLAISLKEDTLTWFDMDSTQHALVNNIAAGSSSVKLRAQAVQTIIGDSVYARLPEHLPYSPEFRLAQEELVSEPIVSYSKVNVYPNPFNNQFNVAWELEHEEAVLQFEVFDLTGRLTHSEQLQASKIGRHMLNLGECQGFYILRVSENGLELHNQKLLCLGN